jgi:AcrR family transcriptional regulator
MTAKERILNSAINEFSLSGYSGTSIKNISERARVTTSLIFHHFKSKSLLWAEVKEKLITDLNLKQQCSLKNVNYNCFESFLNTLVQGWLHGLYNNPDLLRILRWQMLEYNKVSSSSSDISDMFVFCGEGDGWSQLSSVLIEFQETGAIPEHIKVINLIRAIVGLIHSPFHNPMHPTQSISDLDSYSKFISNMIISSFSTK